MATTTTPVQVRIVDVDATPPVAVVCRPDEIADTLQNGWFDAAPAHVRDAIHALQRAVLAGTDATGLERVLGVRVEPSGVEPPAGAMRVSGWEHADHSGVPQRYFRGTRRGDDHARVGVSGVQWADGRVERWAWVEIADPRDDTFTAAQARELAQHLAAAADELDALNTDGPTELLGGVGTEYERHDHRQHRHQRQRDR